jgi:4-amino-4-deoxy-L-arabinose transferase-like glycosyltransferase
MRRSAATGELKQAPYARILVPAANRNPFRGTADFWLPVALMVLAASLFRFAIADYSLWFDEQASMFFAQQPMAKLWSGWMIREPNPPLFYALLKLWVLLFGDSERAVRTLSMAAGAGSIVTTAYLTREIHGRKAGIIAAGLTALATQQLHYSLQLRAYELVCFTASCVLISLVSIERSWRLGRVWTGSVLVYAIGCIASIDLHTTMFLLPVICTIALVIVRHREILQAPKPLLPLMLANLAIALATGWWLDITLRQIWAGTANSAVFDQVTLWLVVRKTIGVLSFAKETGVARTFISLIVTGLVIFQVRRSWATPETRLLLAVLGVSVILFGLISLKLPIFLPRTMFWLSTIATSFCAAALAGISRRSVQGLAIFGLGSLVAVNMATSVATRQTEDWTSAIRRAESVPGARLIVQGEAMGLLVTTACARLHHRPCPVPIIAVTTPDDHLDNWSHDLYSGEVVGVDDLDRLPAGQYFVFRKQSYHDLLTTLHQRGLASSLSDDSPLLGPVDRSELVR